MDDKNLSTADVIRSLLGIALFFLIFLIATPLIIALLIITLGKATNVVIERFVPLMVRPVMWITGIDFSIRIHAGKITGPAVFIINHSSTVDLLTILALGLPRVRFVAKWELQYNPLFFLLGHLTGQVFIKRQDTDRAVATLQHAKERIKREKLSVLFAPEGSRKHPGVIGPFKKGPFRMALDLGYPIVPIYFEGNRNLSSGGSLLVRSGEAIAHIHPPIDTSHWSLERLDEHIREVRQMYLDWAGVD